MHSAIAATSGGACPRACKYTLILNPRALESTEILSKQLCNSDSQQGEVDRGDMSPLHNPTTPGSPQYLH